MGGTVDQVSHTTTGVAGGWTAQVVVDSASYALSAVTPPSSSAPGAGTRVSALEWHLRHRCAGRHHHGRNPHAGDVPRQPRWRAWLVSAAPRARRWSLCAWRTIGVCGGPVPHGDVYTFTTRVPKAHVQVQGLAEQTVRWSGTAALMVVH
jgi:hypothetical protein